MPKIKPLTLSFDNADELEKAKAEYDFIGREVDVDRKNLTLVVRTIPRTSKRKVERENKLRNRDEN